MAVPTITVKKLNASSLNAVVGLSNDNFATLATSLGTAFSKLNYDPDAKTVNLPSGQPGVYSFGAANLTFTGMLKLVDGSGNKIASINDLADGGAGIINAPGVHANRIGVKNFVLQDASDVLQSAGENGQIAWGVIKGVYDYWAWDDDTLSWVSLTSGGGGGGGGGTSAYGDTLKATLAAGATTLVVMFELSTVRAANVVYDFVRGSMRQMGRMSITQDGTTPTLLHEYQQLGGNSGVTFQANLNAVIGEVDLLCTVTAGANNVDFAYAIQNILN